MRSWKFASDLTQTPRPLQPSAPSAPSPGLPGLLSPISRLIQLLAMHGHAGLSDPKKPPNRLLGVFFRSSLQNLKEFFHVDPSFTIILSSASLYGSRGQPMYTLFGLKVTSGFAIRTFHTPVQVVRSLQPWNNLGSRSWGKDAGSWPYY